MSAEDAPEPPLAYVCPLTQTVMNDPVIDPEGNSYERSAIEEWLSRDETGVGTSPVTRRRLAISQLAPNRALKDAIEEWLRTNQDGDAGARAGAGTAEAPTRPAGSQQITTLDTTIRLRATVVPLASRALPGDANVPAHALHVVLEPPADSPERTPLDLVCVVDVSGSMGSDAVVKTGTTTESSGLSVLDIVRHALSTMAHTMGPNDRLAIVKFTDKATTVLPLTAMNEQGLALASRKIAALVPEDSTNIFDGLKTGLELLTTASRIHSPLRSNPYRMPHVVLLTDGVPNIEPPRGTLPSLVRFAAANPLPPISTFGFGYDVESKLLRGIAELGKGMYSFIPDAGMVGTSFVNLTAWLYSRLPLRKPVLNVTTSGGVRIAANGAYGGPELNVTYSDGGAKIQLPDGAIGYGQPRSFLFRLEGWTGAEGQTVNVALDYDVGKTDHTADVDHKTVSANAAAADATDAAVAATYERILFHDLVKANLPPPVLADTHALFASLQGALPPTSPIAQDIGAQVLPALSRSDWFSRWGCHYLPSLARAHLLQVTHNFKDVGVQGYGPEDSVFGRERDKADQVFLSLPPPTPSRPRTQWTSSLSGGSAPAPQANMRMYYDADNPCFHPDSPVLMASGSTSKCSNLAAGQLIRTTSGHAAPIVCILRTRITSGRALLSRLPSGLLVTPWHPVRDDSGEWRFPVELAEPRWRPVEAVYSFVLGPPVAETSIPVEGYEPIMVIAGVSCITLGHQLRDPKGAKLPRTVRSTVCGTHEVKNVAWHPYFATDKVVDDLRTMPGWERGLVEFDEGCMLRAEEGEGSGGDALLRGFRRDKVVEVA
ncbi:hint-domain-containing protein [Hyaloraphidium curvatum]|nr:hint-domain-containing protein [Hyaloraphidium curvatum]